MSQTISYVPSCLLEDDNNVYSNFVAPFVNDLLI